MLLTILVFFLILGLLVLVHELGHFITAKKAGVKIEEFGFGFPPRILGFYKDSNTKRWKKVGLKTGQVESTIYSINWIPLGGFVKIKGEQGENSQDKDSFGNKSIGRRIFIISAGVLMNIILAAVLLSVGFGIGLPQILDGDELPPSAKIRDKKTQIIDIIEGLPAQKQGLQLGDSIISIDGKQFSELSAIQEYFNEKTGNTVVLTLLRGKEKIIKEIEPELIKDINRGGIGVLLVETAIISYPWYLSVFKGFETTFFLTKEIIIAFYRLFSEMIFTRQVMVDVSGPVGIAVITGQVVKLGFIYILQFAALLSINLAIINFLPFPALDGGRVLFLVLEKIRGKPIDSKVEAIIHNLGFAILMILIVAVTYRDIFRYSENLSGIWGRITNLF